MRRLKFICAASVAMLALVTPGVASAQQYPPVAAGPLVLSANTVAPGGSVVIGGAGCQANSEVDVGISSGESGEALGTTESDGDGNFEATVTIPSDLATGNYTLVANCISADGTSTLQFSSAITVAAAGSGTTPTTTAGGGGGGGSGQAPGLTPAAPGATLPRTGPESALPIAQVAVAMLAVGSVMVALVWRRRQTADVAGTSVDA